VLDGGIVVNDGLARRDPNAAASVEAWCRRHRLPGAAKLRSWRFDTVRMFCRELPGR
jgi:hypothetical protein